ncbi:hypothetical protein F5Y10DRAFT_291558 [Nemania abortiva]|nr:hypothetical protein F5Y10DRAFT_291558 [Nemania abortiva]
MKAIRRQWKQKEIEEMLKALDMCRDQLIFRILLDLEATSKYLAKQGEDTQRSLSRIVEVNAIFQERQNSSTTNQTRRIIHQIDETNTLLKSFKDETIMAVLEMADGKTRVLPHEDQGALTAFNSERPKMFMQFKLQGSRPDLSMRSYSQADAEKMNDVLVDSLYFRQMTDRWETIKLPHQQTYEWIFSDPELTEQPWDNLVDWLEHGSGCYWICGKAGSGKSTLMKFVCGHDSTSAALRHWGGHELRIASFFFYGQGHSMQKNQIGLLRSLLYDVLSADRDLISDVMTELLPIVAKDLLIGAADNAHDEPVPRFDPPAASQAFAEPSLPELIKWFKRLLGLNRGRRYFFLIDGIDEFDGDPSTIVDLIMSLGQLQNAKFLISSRPIPPCVENFAGFPHLQLHDLTRDDIRKIADDLLHHKLQLKDDIGRELQLGGPSYVQLIDQIVEKSSGVFIWVVVAIQSLLRGLENRDRISEMQKRLEELPTDLADLYTHMFSKMPATYRRQAVELFRLALSGLSTQDPCPLTVLQLSFAEDEPSHVLDIPVMQITESEEISRCDETEGRLRSRCCGLLETRRAKSSEQKMMSNFYYTNPCVDFLHRTVVEFLNDPRVMEKMIEWGDPSFTPEISLFHSCERMCKSMKTGRINDNRTIFVWHMMKSAMKYLSICENSERPIPMVYINDLDCTMMQHWEKVKTVTDRLMRRGHWVNSFTMYFSDTVESNILDSLDPPLDFMTLATVYALHSTFKHELQERVSISADEDRKSVQLHHTVGCILSPYWNELNSITRVQMLQICETLIEAGANPNLRFGTKSLTAWVAVLQYALLAKENKHAFITEFRNNGFPRVFAKLVVLLIAGGADVNVVVITGSKNYRYYANPIIQRQSALCILGELFNSSPSNQLYGAFLAPDKPGAQEIRSREGTIEWFHEFIFDLLTKRGAVARIWENERLVFGPPEGHNKHVRGLSESSGIMRVQGHEHHEDDMVRRRGSLGVIRKLWCG